MSNRQRPHGLQPSRLLHPWDFPGKSTGVGCHCLLQLSCLRLLESAPSTVHSLFQRCCPVPLLLLLVPLWSLVPGFQCLWCPGLEHLHGGLLLPCPRSPDSQAVLLLAVCEGDVAPGMVRGASAVSSVVRFVGSTTVGHAGRGQGLGTSAAEELDPRLHCHHLLVAWGCRCVAAWRLEPRAPLRARRPGCGNHVHSFPGSPSSLCSSHMCGILWRVGWRYLWIVDALLVVVWKGRTKGTFQTALLLTSLCHRSTFCLHGSDYPKLCT